MGQVGTEATLQQILSKVHNIEGYTDILANGWTTHDWHGLKRLVEDKLASHEFPVGSQVIDSWAKDANTTYSAPWDVVHYDTEDNLYLKWHYAIPDGIPFDAPEAIWYADANNILTAGTYNIAIGSNYGSGWITGQSIQFTLTADLAEGDQIFINCGTDQNVNPTNARAWNVYAQGSTTSKQSGTTTNGTDGTNLGIIGNVSAQRTNGLLNAISRVVYGSGRWSESAIRQYLNSTEAVGAWWVPKNGWDRPPSQLSSVRGFLAGMDSSFLEIVEPVPVVTALNTVEGFSDATETTMDRIFLPSLQEMYIQPQLAGVEGVDWDYFKDLASDAGLTGKFQQYGTYPILISYNVSSTTSPVYVWLRSASRSTAYNAWYVNSSGDVSSGNAYNARRGCPACKILSS